MASPLQRLQARWSPPLFTIAFFVALPQAVQGVRRVQLRRAHNSDCLNLTTGSPASINSDHYSGPCAFHSEQAHSSDQARVPKFLRKQAPDVFLGEMSEASVVTNLIGRKLPQGSFAATPPDEMVAAIFIVICSLYCSKLVLVDILGAAGSEELRAKRDGVAHAYNDIVGKMVGQLKEVRNSSAMEAELGFRAQARHFQQLMAEIAKNPHRHFGIGFDESVFLEPFRQLTRFWLKVFEQCALSPRKEPRRVVSESQLHQCKSIKELAELVARRMAASPVVFISGTSTLIDETDEIVSHQQRKSKSHQQRKPGRHRANVDEDERGGLCALCCCCCCCGSLCPSWVRSRCSMSCGMRMNPKGGTFPLEISIMCISVKMVSWIHCGFLVASVIGVALGVELYVAEKWLSMAAVGTTVVLLLVILFWVEEIDERIRLYSQVTYLKQQHAKVEQSHREVDTKYSKMTKLVNLWQFRTQPQLGLFKDLSDLLIDIPDGEKLHYLTGIVERLEKVDHALGDLWMWVGAGSFEEKNLRMIGRQLSGVAHLVMTASQGAQATKSVLDVLSNVFGFVTVRVIACHHLTNQGRTILGEVSDPYVICRIGKDSSRKFRTPTISDSLNPRWFRDDEPPGGSEFFPLASNEKVLEIEVFDENKWTEDTPMGYLRVDFKTGAPGLWHRKAEKLWGHGSKKQSGHGEIEYEYYYANCMRLLHTSWNHSPQARPQHRSEAAPAQGLQDLSTFLEEAGVL